MNMKLEVVMVPVSNVDRAKDFYARLGFREDIDIVGDNYRLVQFTPPGSSASIFIGSGITTAEPGSIQGIVLVVDDIQAAHDELTGKGIEVEEIFHDEKGLLYYTYKKVHQPGPDPDHNSYRSFTAFTDPDGNGWIVQEIKQRLPGR